MSIPPLFVIVVLGFVALLRLAFGAGHLAVYRWFARRFARARAGRLATAGRALSLGATLLPVVGAGRELARMVSTYRALPPGGLRRLTEIPLDVLAGVLSESVQGIAVCGLLLAMLWWQGCRA